MDEEDEAATAGADAATADAWSEKALVSAAIKKRKLYRQLTGTEVPWFPHDNDIELLKELCWEAGRPRWVYYGTPAGGAGIHGCIEMGCSVLALCYDEHHRKNLEPFLPTSGGSAMTRPYQICGRRIHGHSSGKPPSTVPPTPFCCLPTVRFNVRQESRISSCVLTLVIGAAIVVPSLSRRRRGARQRRIGSRRRRARNRTPIPPPRKPRRRRRRRGTRGRLELQQPCLCCHSWPLL